MRIILFLGSGVSYKSGLPDINNITQSLLNEDWWSHTDSNFYRGQNSNEYFRRFDITPKIQLFLRYLKEYSDEYFKNRKSYPASYEDIFFIVKQIHDELTGESDNPAIHPFIEHLQSKYKFGANKEFSHFDQPLSFKDVVWKAEDYINCVIWQSLPIKTIPIGFDLLNELFNYEKVKSIDVTTLNHDLLIETYLSNKKIDFADGFTDPDGDFCYFKPELFEVTKSKIKLNKLHGSLNWYRLRYYDKDSNKTTDFYTKVLRNHWHCHNAKGEFIGSTLESYPIFLTGTGNKLAAYNFGIPKHMHLRFDKSLIDSNIIIMSGYGWNDKGINGWLMEWILSGDERKIILLHEVPESIKKSKSAMWHRYDDLVKWGRLIPVKKWLSDTKLEDIEQFI